MPISIALQVVLWQKKKKQKVTACLQAPLLLFTAVISLLLCTGVGFFCVVFVSGVQDLVGSTQTFISFEEVFFLYDDYEVFLTFPVVFSMLL